MTEYKAIDDAIATGGRSLTGAISALLVANTTINASTRLRKSVACWPGHETDTADYTLIDGEAIVGPYGCVGYDVHPAVHTPVYGQNAARRGLQFSTPTDTPLTVRIPWPMSANADTIRVVMCIGLSGRAASGGAERKMQCVAQVYTGGRFYPKRYGIGDLEVVDVSADGYDTSDVRTFNATVLAGANAVEIGGSSVTGESLCWVDVTVDISDRPTPRRDDVAMRDGDAEGRSFILLHFLSRPADLDNASYRLSLAADLAQKDGGLTLYSVTNSGHIPDFFGGTQNVGGLHYVIALPDTEPLTSAPDQIVYVASLGGVQNDIHDGTEFHIWPRCISTYDPSNRTIYALENIAATLYSISIEEQV